MSRPKGNAGVLSLPGASSCLLHIGRAIDRYFFNHLGSSSGESRFLPCVFATSNLLITPFDSLICRMA